MTGLAKGAKWIGASQLVKVAAQVAGIFVLARLMSPSDYGLVALVSVVTTFAMLFKDLGSSAAIIQTEELSESLLTTAFWLNMLLGASLTGLVCISSLFAPELFDAPLLTPALLTLSIAFPMLSSSAVHQALLERSQQFDIVAKAEIAAATIGLTVAVVSAYHGAGVFSVVYQTLCASAISSLLLWRGCAWRPASPTGWRQAHFLKMLRYSGGLIGFNFVNYIARNADSVIVGRMLSTAVLGAYSLAYRIMLFPLQSLTVVVSRSLFPTLARLQGDQTAMKVAYFSSVRVVAFVVAPLMAGIYFLREPFVRLVFGEKWGLSSDILAWLAPTGLLQALMSTTGVVFMATGKTRLLFKLGIIGAVLQVGAFLLGVQYGVVVMAACYLVSNLLNAIPVAVCCLNELGAKPSELWRCTWRPIAGAGVMIASLAMIYGGRVNDSTLGWPQLMLMVAAGVSIYLLMVLLVDRKTAADLLRAFVPGRLRSGGER